MEKYPDLPIENVNYFKKGEYWFSHFNQMEETTKGLPKSFQVHDVTMRDGEQTPGLTFLEDERVRIAELLDDIGVARIEGGMPSVSEVQHRALKRMCKLNLKKSKIFGFGFAKEKDAEMIIEAGCDGAVIEHSASALICEHAYKLKPIDVVNRLVKPMKMTKDAGLYTSLMAWDWFRTPIEFTKWMVESVLEEVDIDGVVIVDTWGNTTPEAVYYVIDKFHKWFPNLSLEFHGHNDHGMGVACCFSALKAGAEVVHGAINGIGDRAGNVSTEQIIVNAQHYYGLDTGADLKAIYAASEMVSKFAKVPIQPYQPFVGERPYQYENGTMSDIATKLENARGFSPFSTYPSVVGKPTPYKMLLGKNVGVSGVKRVLKKYNLTATDEQAKELTAQVKAEGLLTKDVVSEDRFISMYNKMTEK